MLCLALLHLHLLLVKCAVNGLLPYNNSSKEESPELSFKGVPVKLHLKENATPFFSAHSPGTLCPAPNGCRLPSLLYKPSPACSQPTLLIHALP